MRCRKTYETEDKKRKIVWFGSVGCKRAKKIILTFPTNTTVNNDITGTTITNVNILSNLFNQGDTIENIGNNEFKISFANYTITNKNFTVSYYKEIDNENPFYTEEYKLDDNNSCVFKHRGSAIKPDTTNSDYSERQNAVKDMLLQKLNIIQGELWYDINYGLPLMDKIRNKGIFDAVILDIITSCKEVRSITYFNSSLNNHEYYVRINILTIYNEEISISTTI